MSVFDSHFDTPGAIRVEGEQITLRFDRTGPTTGRVSWNIPPPANGCTSDESAYCGMLVTIDIIPASRSTAPVDGVQYTADPTADPDLHAGDTIGTSLVIGAFYEAEEKGTGQELTTFFDVSNLDADLAYYVSGYAVDCVNRYHTQGVFAYSQNFGSTGTRDTSAFQIADMGDGVALTDGTGLSLGTNYQLDVNIDGVEYTLTINGDDAQTYQDMIDALNNEIEKLTPAPQSPVSPNTGVYWYDTDTGKLFQWDGTQLVELSVLNEPTDPTALAVGDYWYDTANNVLNRWNGTDWVVVPDSSIIEYSKDLTDTDKLTVDDYWLQTGSPLSAYQWCGNVWCEKTLIVQEQDPTLGINPDCGTFWYNPDDEILRQWNERTCTWDETNAIYWNVDPSATGSPALLDGSYWFDETNQVLSRWSTPVADFWNQVTYGYQDIFLDGTNAPYTLDTVALEDGTYTDDIAVNGEILTVTLTICNATEGTFREVFAEINRQLEVGSPGEASATIDFRGDPTGLALRLTSSTGSAPEIQAGGDLFSSIIDWSSNGTPTDGTTTTIGAEPTTTVAGQYWVDTTNEKVFQRDGTNTEWERLCAIFFPDDPTDRESCDLWWNSDTDELFIWNSVTNKWMDVVAFIQDTTDPAGSQTIEAETLWYVPPNGSPSDALFEYDGVEWLSVNFVKYPTDPTQPNDNDVWRNNDTWAFWDGTEWVSFDPVNSSDNPSQATIPTGTFWYDTMNGGLFQWNGTNWVSIMTSATNPTPSVGDYWYDTSTDTLNVWNGTEWVQIPGIAVVGLTTEGNLIITATSTGSTSFVEVDRNSSLLSALDAFSELEEPICGTDGLEGVPTYAQLDVGTDGSSDERREMTDTVRRQLGYPVIEVELDKEQLNIALNVAIEELRRRSASAFHRGFMKLPIRAGVQRYQLSNKTPGYVMPDGSVTGYNHIGQVMGVFRTTSAFMTSAHGSGVFGQVVLQHLYNMGTFDLLSFHLVSEYIEQLEHLFASRVTFSWDENSRVLWLHQVFSQNEMAIMDVAVERTEQELLVDRFTSRWIEQYTLAYSKKMLAQIRGKYASLPGAGGGVSLNASDLQAQADAEMEELISQIDNYQVNNVEEFGQHCEFIIG